MSRYNGVHLWAPGHFSRLYLNNIYMDPFWGEDLTVLLDKNRATEFVPRHGMLMNEKLNAIMRAAVYVSILLVIIGDNTRYFYLVVLAAIVTYTMKHQQVHDERQEVQPLQAPTKDNPFMNVLLTDYVQQPNRGPASDIESPAVSAAVEDNFNQGLFRDMSDIWDKGNSQRQFYTNPATTIPNDRDSFMKWCWQAPPTCKEGNLTRCLKYEDLRA